MKTIKTTWAAYGSTALFVLLWGSGAISSRWALDHSSAFAILTLRFALALVALLAIAALRRQFLPQPGSRRQVLVSGLALIGGYSICYFLALENGVTPGVLATVLGVQPILTLVLVERRFSAARLAGLLLALGGLALVVQQGLSGAGFSALGMLFALLALGCVTFGAILQKRIGQAPQQVLPLQYMASLLLCLLFVPFRPFEVDWVAGFVLPWLWLGLVISVGAQLLLYRLIQAGNLVNVTGLFYLVPVVTALLDHLLLGNALPLPGWIGMAIIFAGLGLAFRQR
ncbi:MAG TPA: EamA family transporter [Pseudomonas sp.]|jgi:drug/metabolite transporter (DMT)-like permease|uniref:DMT family transporter n=1 Tax=Stutzerimonas balearica TaxID=74829 RepID=UPI000C39B971|nr:EamA family transporter [Pseudomonas sp.]HAF92565.1 EamA family transporter [Pseudomonas sp.]HAV86904.1 EamA family transporter [Pseudomonas sp.]